MVAQQQYGVSIPAQAETRDSRWELTRTHEQRWLYLACKRLLDILIAASLLILLAPLMLMIAVLVKLDSPGPAIFKQERVRARRRTNGRGVSWDIETFTFYKFRSMRHDADCELHRAFVKAWIRNDKEQMVALQRKCDETASEPLRAPDRAFSHKPGDASGPHPEAQGQVRKLMHDPRITRVGGILRQSSLDELPQLWNVLNGEMSLVGPRPDLPYSVVEYKPWHLERLHAKPGVTGLWQVEGRSQVSWDDFVRMDIEYIRHQSLSLDLKILLKTPLKVLQGDGAA